MIGRLLQQARAGHIAVEHDITILVEAAATKLSMQLLELGISITHRGNSS